MIHVPLLRIAVVVAALAGSSCSFAGADDRHASGPSATSGTASSTSPRELWRWNVPSPGSAGMPAAAGHRIAFTYGHIAVVLLDKAGNQLWKADRVGVGDVAPLITEAAVLVATDDGVAAFGRDDGRSLWDTDVADRANTPSEVGGVVVTTTWDGSLVALDSGDGSVRWRVLLPGSSLGPPTVTPVADASTPGVAIATWDSGRGAGATAVSVVDGRVLWEVDLMPGGVSAPTVVGVPGSQVVVVVAGDVAAHGLSATDGHELWSAPLDGSGSPEVPPTAGAEGEIVAGHRLGGFSVLDTATGSVKASASSDGVAVRDGPVQASGGRVAMPLDDGRILIGRGDSRSEFRPAEGRVSGLAVTDDGTLLVGTRARSVEASTGLSGGVGAGNEPAAARGRRARSVEASTGAEPAALIAFTGW